MELFWKVRRRPSALSRVFRSALMVGAAVVVPVGLEAIRRLVRRSVAMRAGRSIAAAMGANGRGASGHGPAISKRSGGGAHRRKRSAALART